MELPPLSPGIQDRVIDVVVVLVTVRRGWSGGTESRLIDIDARSNSEPLIKLVASPVAHISAFEDIDLLKVRC